MATKNIVPRANKEGQLGTDAKQWNKVIAHTGSFQAVSSSLIPDSADTYDLGSATKFWKDLYISSGSINFIDPSDNSVTSTISVSSDGTLNIGSAVVSGSSIPDADNTYDLGSSAKQWKDLYINGTANIDTLTLTSGASVTSILDEDAMGSDSATALATQQSIKAYVDSQVTAQDLDFQGDSGGALSIDLDSETLDIAGDGAGISTAGSGNQITISGDHDALTNFVANEHIDHTSVTLTAGTGLTGGGDISSNRTFAVDGVLEDLDTLGAAGSDGQFIVATGAGAFQYESGATALTSLGGTATGQAVLTGSNAAAIRSTIGVDAAGTDNSTDVTLTGTPNYITISGQEITRNTIDIGDDTNLTGGTGITLTGDTLSTTDSEIVHDNLSGFVANEHIDHTSVTLTAGSGLTGGGTIASNRTFAVGAGTHITVNSNDVEVNTGTLIAAISGSIVTTANVTSAGALMDSEVDADIKTLSLPASTTISAFGKTLVDDAAASNARTTLGLGTSAVLDTAAIANGGSGVATADQIHTFVTTQTDSTAADTSGNAATATLASTVTVSDSTSNTNFPITFHDESNALLDDTGAFTYNPSTATLKVTNLTVEGSQSFVDQGTLVVTSSVQFEGATPDGFETTLTVVDPTADRTITLPNATGTVVLANLSQTLTNKTLTSPDINTPDIDGGTIDGATIATSDVTVGTGKTLNVSGGTLTTSTAQKVAIIGGGDTDDLSEGSSNLYYTDARVKTKLTAENVVSGSATNVRTFLNVEDGADVTDTSNVTSAGALMDSEVTDLDGIKSLTVPNDTTISTFGASLVDDANASTARTTLGVDAAGTDNSTDVTLSGTPDYITISGQTITRNQIDLANDVTGTLPTSNTAAKVTSIVAGDGIDVSGATGDVTVTAENASATNPGVVELATTAETTTGTDTTRAVTPDGLKDGYQGSSNVTTLGTIGTGTWQGSVIASAYLDSDTAHLSGTQTFSGDKTFSGGVHISTSSDPKLQFTSAEAGTDNYEIFVAASGLKFRNTSDSATPLELNEDGSVIITGLGGSDGATGFPSLRLSNSVASGDWDTGDVVGNLEFYVEDTSGNAPYVASFIKSVNPQNNGTLPGGYLSFGTCPYNQSGGATEEFRMETDGDFHAIGDVVAYSSTPSDERLKDNVVTIDSGLSLVNQLRGVTFDWNQGSKQGKKDYGVIAQEVEKVIPEVVSEKKLPLITDNDEVYKTVDYEKLTAVLIEAVKDLSKEIDDIKQKCDCLNK